VGFLTPGEFGLIAAERVFGFGGLHAFAGCGVRAAPLTESGLPGRVFFFGLGLEGPAGSPNAGRTVYRNAPASVARSTRCGGALVSAAFRGFTGCEKSGRIHRVRPGRRRIPRPALSSGSAAPSPVRGRLTRLRARSPYGVADGSTRGKWVGSPICASTASFTLDGETYE
jgi:hypothetical protein